MGLFDWFRKGGAPAEDPRLGQWRKAWAAVDPVDGAAVARLAAELDAMALPEDDVEIEREMLEGLEHLAALKQTVEVQGLPAIATGHRVVGTDVCHFSAPVSMPDEPTQPSGRLLLTATRAIFIGGPNGATIPWHGVGETLQAERDVVLVRSDRERLHRFRCNAFSDAMCAAFLARQLASARRRKQGA
jgi:hypothetical protein